MRGVRAVLFAFCGALAWFLWTTSGQSTGSCFSDAHYVPSAAVALVVITGLAVATEAVADSRRTPTAAPSLTVTALTAASLTAIGLAVAIFFSAVVSCSGG